MDERDAPHLMGMGIRLGRRAVGGPAGVGHANVPGRQMLAFQGGFQHADAPHRPADMQMAFFADANAGGIIPAVLEPLKTFQQQGLGVFLADVRNNSTHKQPHGFQFLPNGPIRLTYPGHAPPSMRWILAGRSTT